MEMHKKKKNRKTICDGYICTYEVV